MRFPPLSMCQNACGRLLIKSSSLLKTASRAHYLIWLSIGVSAARSWMLSILMRLGSSASVLGGGVERSLIRYSDIPPTSRTPDMPWSVCQMLLEWQYATAVNTFLMIDTASFSRGVRLDVLVGQLTTTAQSRHQIEALLILVDGIQANNVWVSQLSHDVNLLEKSSILFSHLDCLCE